MNAIESLSPGAGVRSACEALAVPRASFYRKRVAKPEQDQPETVRPPSHRALSAEERGRVLEILHSDRFVDVSPAEVHATMLDEGEFICSPRTYYRILKQEKENGDRRNQRTHPKYAKPELLATGPNEVWSWDITKLRGPKYVYFCLYVILDIFSRYVVGWTLALSENSSIATTLIEETYRKQGIQPEVLQLHSDRGSPMKAKTTGQLLASLGVNQSLSRPRVSNDNPFSESQFKTLKYGSKFPARFGSFEDALSYCRYFFNWYNNDHRHSGIAWLTPSDLHHDRSTEIVATRQRALVAAYERHPERFSAGFPEAKSPPTKVWINPPAPPSTQDVEPTPNPDPQNPESDAGPRQREDRASASNPFGEECLPHSASPEVP